MTVDEIIERLKKLDPASSGQVLDDIAALLDAYDRADEWAVEAVRRMSPGAKDPEPGAST